MERKRVLVTGLAGKIGGIIRKNPDVGFAIRFWKRSLKDAGTLFELKRRKHYVKKSQ